MSISTNARTAEPRSEFPTRGMLPKADSQAADFLRKHPDYDGRGVVVAVLDTGIDPGAKGLQVTSDGKRKVIDYIDCSGSGDVALAKPQKCSGDALELRADSGRMLRLNKSWTNPSGEWRLGTRCLYEIVPPTVKMNVTAEREIQFRKDAQQLADSVNARKDNGSDGSGDEERAEIDAQANVLGKLGSAYSDPGPVLDCVVFHDGQQWRAAIDVAESGDLSEASAMGAYKSTGDVGLLSRRHLLYYTLNFYDDGRTLSIVTSVGSHGSHVAGVIAANHPEEPENNGVAPGAQLLSLAIANHSMNGMETGIGLTRAAKAIIEYGVDMANISFGEPTNTPNRGQWVQMVRREVVRHRRCIFVGSAGNEGPALSTVTAPGGTTDDFIGVGAYVGYDQMIANYSMYETVNDTVCTWSSRGPTLDGARGVDIYAPGSAIASYPAYTKQRLQMASGTSMSAPSLCGCLALLVSAWKQEFGCDNETQRISPYRVRNAILNTAKPICDELGTGMIQTDAAWQFLKAHAERDFEDLSYTVRVSDSGDARGIYLRDFEESAHVRHMQIQVTPEFPGDVRARFGGDRDGSYGQQEGQRRFDFEQRTLLVATASWVRAPEAVYIGGNGCSFSVRIDPTLLKLGQLHVAAIDAYDSTNVDRGPIFSIPITVTKPLPVDLSASVELGCLRFQPTEIVRRFIAVPVGATQALITTHVTNAAAQESAPAIFYLHCLQLVPQERFRPYSMKQRITVGHQSYVAGGGTAEQKFMSRMDVTGGATLEMCITPYWSQHGTHEMNVCIEFNGIVPANTGCLYFGDNQLDTGVVINGNHGVARADFMALIRPEYNINPMARLDTLRTAKRPETAVIVPIDSERDIHPMTESAIYRLVLDYKIETKTNNVRLRPRIPVVDSKIYESWADDFALAIFDANKRCVVSINSYTKIALLEKAGDYLVRVMIRHRNSKDLEALKSMALMLDISLSSPIMLKTAFDSASIFTTTVDGKQLSCGSIPRGGRLPLFFNTEIDTLPNEASPGDVLCGTLSMSGKTAGIPLTYIVPTKSKTNDNGTASTLDSIPKSIKKEGESQVEKDCRELGEALRNVRLEWVKKVKEESVREKLVAVLLTELNNNGKIDDLDGQRAAVLAAQLEAIDCVHTALPWCAAAGLNENAANKAIKIADVIVALTHSRALNARLYSNQAAVKSENEKKLMQQLETAKTQLVGALTSKCRAVAFLVTRGLLPDTATEASAGIVNAASEEQKAEHIRSYEKAAAELSRWTERAQQTTGVSFLVATLPLHIAKRQFGRALLPVVEWLAKAPLKHSNASERKTMVELRGILLTMQKWFMWVDHFRVMAAVQSPSDYGIP
ncbi:hypothetical protein H4S08_001217 [Coemansia sp. RSA 1365]|nr:hypothetical protein H4S08_001217 [Coemansia sp. RSA 1365]